MLPPWLAMRRTAEASRTRASRATYAKEGWRANCLYTANAYPYEVKTLKRVLFVTASLRPEAQYSELTTAHAK